MNTTPLSKTSMMLVSVAIGLTILPVPPDSRGEAFHPAALPMPPAIEVRDTVEAMLPLGLRAASGPTLYSIGQPTDEEQLYLEYINRARASPPTEGLWLAGLTDSYVLNNYSYFGVNTNALVLQFSTNAATAPLSMSSNLTASARRHSQDMLANVFQGHTGSDGSTMTSRISDAGYLFSAAGENVYSYSYSVLHGHAGFNVDWGYGPDGMQSPPGHRMNILSGLFREVGVGVILGSNSTTNGSTVSTVGPQLVTQDFGARSGQTPFITGVAFLDLNDNGTYDLGEGLGGIRVDVAGANYYALTANAGGFSIPVPGNGAFNVSFSFDGAVQTQSACTVTGSRNAKLDFSPAYQAPTVSGTTQPFVGCSNLYAFTPVIAATNYQWRLCRLVPYWLVDGAESGGTNMAFSGGTTYPKITNTVKYAGTYSFHLAHPEPGPQAIEVKRLLRPGTNALLRFASRLGWASPDQVARTQVSTNGGVNWLDLWAQAGTNGAGETSFIPRTNSLAAYTGREVRVRFVYDFTSGSYYSGINSGVGWYVDEIAFSGMDELGQLATNSVDSTSNFTFMPADTNRYELSVRAQLSGRTLSFGPAFLVGGTLAPPRLIAARTGISMLLRWPTNQSGFTLQATPFLSMIAAWTNVPGSPSVQGTNYQLSVGMGAASSLYRLRKP